MKKIISAFLAFTLILSVSASAKTYLLYEDFENGFSNPWRLYGWAQNRISMTAENGIAKLGIGIGASASDDGNGSPYYAQMTAGDIKLRDYTLRADVKLDFNNFEYNGIMVRHQNQNKYYALIFSKNGVCLTKGAPHSGGALSGTNVPYGKIPNFKNTDFNNYKITVCDNRITVFVNDTQIIDYTDAENSCPNGMIGFNAYTMWCRDSYMYIDNVTVTDNADYENDIYYVNSVNGSEGFAVKSQSENERAVNLFGASYGGDKLLAVAESKKNLGGFYSGYTKLFGFDYFGLDFSDDFSSEKDGYIWENNNPSYIKKSVSEGKLKITIGENGKADYGSLSALRYNKAYPEYKADFLLKSETAQDCTPLEYLRIIVGSENGRELMAEKSSYTGKITFSGQEITASQYLNNDGGFDKYEISASRKLITIAINGKTAFSYAPTGEFTGRLGISTNSSWTQKTDVILDNLNIYCKKSPDNAYLYGWSAEMKPFWSDTSAKIITQKDAYYVSKNAPENGDGSYDKPFNTLENARDALRAVNAFNPKSAQVVIKDDIYFLDKPFALNEADSVPDGLKITYKGEDKKRPVISAGVKLIGFTLHDAQKNIYKASAKGLDFRQLYIGNKRAVRAKYPNNDKCLTVSSWNTENKTVTVSENIAFSDLNGAEFNVQKEWGNDILKISEIADNVISFEPKSASYEFTNTNPPKINGQRFWLENKYEFLDEKGEWYLDKENDTVYVIPYYDSDLQSVYAPKLENALLISGKNLKDKVKNVEFSNLTFAHTDWEYPKENPYIEVQSQQYFDGANYKAHPISGVYVKNAENITFSNVRFCFMGSTALEFHRGVKNSSINNCAFYDISGNGISMGVFDDIPNYTNSDRYDPVSEEDITQNITVENCFITRTGSDYFSSAGILAGNCRDVSIKNNEICDLPWSGMSLSWGWSESMTAPTGFFVTDNHIYNVLNRVSDGGGIYFCGNSPESIVSGNYIHNLKYSRYASGAMLTAVYLDQGTKGVTVFDNAVKDAAEFWSNADSYNSETGFTMTNNVCTLPFVFNENALNTAGLTDNSVKSGIIREIARGKNATASSYQDESYAPYYLTDGSPHNNSRWIMNANDTAPWVQADLGDEFYISSLALRSTVGSLIGGLRDNITILASNDENFGTYEVLTQIGQNEWAEDEKISLYVFSQNSYRYIRLKKQPNTFFEMSEISVYGYQN